MNKAITDGVVFTPSPFADGLDVYSSQDGTPGSDTYENAVNAAFVPADQDFGGALEILKTESLTRLRFMGQTPILPGCYLQVRVRIKAVTGNLPAARVAAYAARADGSPIPGATTIGPSTTLTTYGEVVEVSAIVGIGQRGGVDMPWGGEAVYGHFGFDLTGQNGGVVRVDDIIIEDISAAFLGETVSRINVIDYGAIGDGVVDNAAAFALANAAANGRTVFVPEGNFYLGSDTSFDTKVEFEGRVTMPTAAQLLLRRNYDLPSYIEAFEDEQLAFRKAFQALLNNSDHESLDMGGRKVWVTAPIDMQAAVPDRQFFSTRRAIRNGQLEAGPSPDWDDDVVVSQATYSPANARTLINVSNINNIQVGSLITGNGVGREVYVTEKNNGTNTITMSQPLFDGAGTQNFTFTRFKYILDFSGFNKLDQFGLDAMEIQCNGRCSGVLLAPTGATFRVTDTFFSRPKDRGLTSHGTGDQGMLIERCQFLSSEDALTVPARRSIGLNVNANDNKLRNNRATRFKHWAMVTGQNHVITGNHFFQGDGVTNGIRSAGLIIARSYTSSVIAQNYVDNCFIEWTNEYEAEPAFSGGFSFSSLGITDNVFLSGAVAPWFSYIVVKPHGAGHFLNGVNITGNRFRSINGTIDRAERVDTTFSDLDMTRAKNVYMKGNSYHNVTFQPQNAAEIEFTQSSTSNSWLIDCADVLPFGGQTLNIDSIVTKGPIRNSSNVAQYDMPYGQQIQGTDRNQVRVTWPTAVRGTIGIVVRMDDR
ncbi:MAG: glycosyl hydrolase family 28-related protein [Pseudomonadota bacterium]